MIHTCRMWKRPHTQFEVEAPDPEEAPSHYVHEYVKMKVGDISFIEVVGTGLFVGDTRLWMVEAVVRIPGQMIGFLSTPITYEQGEEEIKKLTAYPERVLH